MKSIYVAISCALLSTYVLADDQLARQKNCLACHAVDHKVVGPAFQDVAAKYAGQPDAVDTLTRKVLTGGGGVWGDMKMPPNTQVNEAEARTLVLWVLARK